VQVGETLVAEPASTIQEKPVRSRVKSIHLAHGVESTGEEVVDSADSKTIVSLALSDFSVDEARDAFKRGGILARKGSSPTVASRIEAQMVFFESDAVYAGKEYILRPHVTHTLAHIQTITSKDDITLSLTDEQYQAQRGEMVTADISFDLPCCIEEMATYPSLSRFILSEQNRVVACGKCMRVIA
jgi:elongation factor 1-alpha